GYSSLTATDPNGNTVFGLPPFPVPLECNPAVRGTGEPPNAGMPGNSGSNCGQKNMGGANMRLRLEPTLNVTDQVRVHAQIDVLDNTIMGSTPDSLAGIPGYTAPPA